MKNLGSLVIIIGGGFIFLSFLSLLALTGLLPRNEMPDAYVLRNTIIFLIVGVCSIYFGLRLRKVKKAPLTEKQLQMIRGGWALIILGGLFTLLGGAALYGEFALFFGPEPVRPEFPSDIPREVFSLPDPPSLSIGGTLDGSSPSELLLMFRPQAPERLKIVFDELDNVGGYWAYKNARVTIEGLSGQFNPEPATVEKEWDNTISGRKFGDTVPFYHVTLPLTRSHRYQWITLTATIDVQYPKRSDVWNPVTGRSFTNVTEHQEREAKMFLAVFDDVFQHRQKYDGWKEQRERWENRGTFRFIQLEDLAIMGFSALGVFLLVGGVKVIVQPMIKSFICKISGHNFS